MKPFNAFSTISALLLAAAVFLGLRGQREITTLRTEQESLAAKAEALQTRRYAPPARPSGERKTPRPRTGNSDPIPGVRADLLALVRRKDQPRHNETSENLSVEKDIVAIKKFLRTLGINQILTLLEEFRNSTELSDDAREEAISLLIAAAAERSPRTVLDMLINDKNMDLPFQIWGLQAAIKNLSRSDPHAAMAWIKALPPDSPWITSLLNDFIEHTAYSDPRVAAELMRQYGIDEFSKFPEDLPATFTDPSQCGEWIDILRAAPEVFDLRIRIAEISEMGAPLARQGFEEGTRWISTYLKEPEEIAAMLTAVTREAHNPDTGRWIEWSGNNLSESIRDKQIEGMISQWTTRDHLAAGEWLIDLPDGPTKHAAVAGFAKTVAPYEPDTAMEWARTLPPGAARDALVEACRSYMQVDISGP